MRMQLIVGVVASLVIVAAGAWWGLQTRRLPSFLPPMQSQPRGLVLVSEGLPQGQEWRQDFTFADMDGDGVRDLITAPPRKSEEPWPHIFLRRGERWEPACTKAVWGGFPEQQPYIYGGVAVADFDGDGVLEIALAMHETGIRIFRSRTPGPCGPWEERKDLPPTMMTMHTRSILAADLNNDGRPDLVALAEGPSLQAKMKTDGLVVFWNEPSGWRAYEIPTSEGLFGDDLAVGEVNGDGVPDIAVGSLIDQRPQFAWLSEGVGKWTAATEGLPTFTIAWTVQLVDLDGDGKDELVFGAGGAPIHQNAGPRVYRWDGKRWENISQGLPQVSWVCGVTAADLDGDGHKEIVAMGMYTGHMQVYSRQADGVWSERQTFTLPDAQGLRNEKLRSLPVDGSGQELVIGNFSGGSKGRILAWTWR